MNTEFSGRQTEILSTSTGGGPQPPYSVAATATDPGGEWRASQRVLAVKIEIDWKRDEGKALYNRLRDLGWMAAHYRNMQMRAKWAACMGYRVDPDAQDKNDISKAVRKEKKGELSGDVYSCAEQEVQGAWARDCKKILAGARLPEWKPSAALSIGGKEKQKDSGIRMQEERGQYVLYMRVQTKGIYGCEQYGPDLKPCPDGCWLRLPIAKNTKRDDWQGPILDAMCAWQKPIKKATVHLEKHGITVRLTFKQLLPPLPPMGERVATLSPRGDRLLLRTETQTKDYTSRLGNICRRKDDWDLIRRRALRQIGWRKGHARIKRERLARLSWDDWLDTCLHTWTREIVGWCESQGVGTIQVFGIADGDWPAHRFIERLKYKASDAGMLLAETANLETGAERAVKSMVNSDAKKIKRRRRAVRDLTDQLGE